MSFSDNIGGVPVPPLPVRSNPNQPRGNSGALYPSGATSQGTPYPGAPYAPGGQQGVQYQQGTGQGPPLPPRVGGGGGQSRYPYQSPAYGGVRGGYSTLSPYSSQYSSISRYPPSYMGYSQFDTQNSFISLAEHSALPAFQSIESIVQAFGSVSMMLESSYHAVRASFQAVLGVAEHFTKMKLQISQVFSALAAFRFVKYLYQKLLYVTGLRRGSNPGFADTVWKAEAVAQSSLTEMDLKSPVKWPLLMYLGLTIAAPYLIWKLLGSFNRDERKVEWERGKGEHFIAKSVHSFQSQQPGDLSFDAGQMLVLAPRHLQPRQQGWLLASCSGRTGLVPANYINIIARREGGDECSKGNGAIKQNGDKGQNGANGVAGVSRPDIIEESIVSNDQFESVFDQAFDPDRN
ncbi:peroxisomal membrane protein PEX13 isoform X2 [Eurytemora carolleeae]|uniref:peroxisomal membrane protein PEX13 isoform X1 n=1 Tax=Eurytemora carolleeae TaxID=1294199 RepID=UPI000C769701|nr:peroxisomal membrane protein PEX13 isoform X1 [Eurytemora carolleeae]XP_023331593.1 peroxisomal membrane protein PEX13 isoform X2 [Eurytemora carolleeae]|eukprot:XP_023331592.1 peroxisomal membrane protein PEX13-like isoform X1 [Eurytemora affinis]